MHRPKIVQTHTHNSNCVFMWKPGASTLTHTQNTRRTQTYAFGTNTHVYVHMCGKQNGVAFVDLWNALAFVCLRAHSESAVPYVYVCVSAVFA